MARREASRAAATAALLWLAGCATYQLSANDDSAAGAIRRRGASSFFWGAVPGTIPYDECGLPGYRNGNGLWNVAFQMNPGQVVASAITLGIWMPMDVSFQCAVPRPGSVGIGGPHCGDASALPAPTVAGCAPPAPLARVEQIRGEIQDLRFDLDCKTDATWANLAGSVQVKPRRLCRPKPGHALTVDQRARALALLVQQSEKDDVRIRAVGAGWSFSQAAATDGILVDMRWFGASLPLPEAGDWAPGTVGKFYAHFEAGASVDAVNLALQNAGYSMFTMGGSAGQTWVGAVQTGTHGGDTGYAALADYLRALAVVGEHGELLWIERKSTPLSRGEYAKSIHARAIWDDDLFDAAAVGVGSMGIVLSAVIEVQELETYLLWRQRFDYDQVRGVMQTFDFKGFAWPDPTQEIFARQRVQQQGSDRTDALRHFEVVVNPYARAAGNQGAFVTTVWDNNRLVVPGAANASAVNVNTSIGTVVVRVLEDTSGRDVPDALNVLLPTQYSEITTPVEGPLRVLFPKGIPTGARPMSMEISIARADVTRATDVILREVDDHSTGYYYPGVLAFRFMEKTRALLGFSFHGSDGTPETVTVEFPTVAGVDGTTDFFVRVHRALDAAGIQHAQHLGQWNTYWDEPAGMRAAFGDRLSRFVASRATVLSPGARCRFANEYTDRLGITAPALAPGTSCPAATPSVAPVVSPAAPVAPQFRP